MTDWGRLLIPIDADGQLEEVFAVALFGVVESTVDTLHHLIDGIRLMSRGQNATALVVAALFDPCGNLVFQTDGHLWCIFLSCSVQLQADGMTEEVTLSKLSVVGDIYNLVL